jgi:hypothetical protein
MEKENGNPGRFGKWQKNDFTTSLEFYVYKEN